MLSEAGRGHSRSHLARAAAALAATTAFALVASAGTASAASYASDSHKPDLLSVLSEFNGYWKSSGTNDLHGTVLNTSVLQWNDRVTSWINQNATAAQQFRALQNSAYLGSDGSGYDQSITIGDGLGSILGVDYVKGRVTKALPLTTALLNNSTGTAGAYVSTGTAKATFSYPRPYLPASASASPVTGDSSDCAPSTVNASSLTSIRTGQDWADSAGTLKITRVAATTDTTHAYANTDVTLDPAYGQKGLCTGGAFPSGHTTSAYQAGITLATLLPELAPEILARSSEAGNNRIVLGVHYPLDIVGGRMSAEAAIAARWSDAGYRTDILLPARTELVNYLQAQCGGTLASCIAKQTPYADNPYGGKAIPGGTAQVVSDRASAVTVYTERLSYGFAKVGTSGLAASVPDGAENLLLTAFPTLTDAQRRSILAQTETDSGYPLDTTEAHQYSAAPASWERLNLAAATSATVRVNTDGSVTVLSTGGQAKVTTAQAAKTTPKVAVSLTPSKPRKHDRAQVSATVYSGTIVGTGTVTVRGLGKARTVRLSLGTAKVTLGRYPHAGTVRITVTYNGSTTFNHATTVKKVTVRR